MDTSGQVDTGISAVAPEGEKMLSQSEVNALVAATRKETQEKARLELAALQAELERRQSSPQQAPNQSQSPSNPGQLSVDDIFAELVKRGEQHQYQQAEKAAAENFAQKMAAGTEMFDDFDDTMRDFDYDAFHHVARMAADVENTPQVMYELAKNPQKLANVAFLALTSDREAKKALKKLSDSIAKNEQAQDDYVSTNPPVSAPKPSQVGKDKGLNTIADYKNASWLKM